MRVHVIAFGKLRTPGLRLAADYYQDMIRPWVNLQETELKPAEVPDSSEATRLRVQSAEMELLEERFKYQLSPRSAFYLLDERGKAKSTKEWAELVRSWEEKGPPEVALCIGSSMGFGEELRKKARGIFSLGPQTLPHELARVVLLEQLYRAWSVNRGHPYHHAD